MTLKSPGEPQNGRELAGILEGVPEKITISIEISGARQAILPPGKAFQNTGSGAP
jgi:hypothetical protein